MLDVELRLARGAFELDASWRAPTPGVVALYGPSGAGKTTLALALAGLVPAEGRIVVDGETWLDSSRGVAVATERRRIGYVFQDARLFPHLDVRDNLLFGARRTRESGRGPTLESITQLLGLGSLLDRRPQSLSGGERQRVALGRALLSNPRLLLLDEPLSGLDAPRRLEVLPYLEVLRDHYRIPMVFVSHQYEEVLRLATHLVVMEAGRVLAADTPAALSLDRRLHSRIGSEGVGAVLEVEVTRTDGPRGLVTVDVDGEALHLPVAGADVGARLRLLVLARDVILATAPVQGLSVRNALRGRLESLEPEDELHTLATVATGRHRLLARITHAAAGELSLAPGMTVWALVKAGSLAAHAYRRDRECDAPT